VIMEDHPADPVEDDSQGLLVPDRSVIRYSYVPSPLGQLLLTADGRALTGLYMEGDPCWREPVAAGKQDDSWFLSAAEQLTQYFDGSRRRFELPLAAAGTPFQRKVWAELLTIPHGETVSYGALAARVGNPSASRAVGMANARNPLPILIPCHRVIGADGRLTGYGGGVDRKAWLLAHERDARRRQDRWF
jgi:methylated-DNA-[protein]-cysteine S-methyltransferase